MAFQLLLCGDGGVDLCEGGRDVGRRVAEGGAGVTDGDAHELDASSISSEGAKEGGYLSVFLASFSWQPRSLQNPISKGTRKQPLRSK